MFRTFLRPEKFPTRELLGLRCEGEVGARTARPVFAPPPPPARPLAQSPPGWPARRPPRGRAGPRVPVGWPAIAGETREKTRETMQIKDLRAFAARVS